MLYLSNSTLKSLIMLNITYISAATFYIQSYYYKNASFFISLYKLDYIINKREDLNNNVTLKEIKAKVLV
jgi:hypothetical protein